MAFSVQVEITSHCNLKCRMCPLTTESTLSSLHPGHISEATWASVVRLIRRSGMARISGFGEPLTHPKVYQFLTELDDLGIVLAMTTNGTALTPANCRKLAELEHLFHVNVSIDSPDPAIYHEIRGGDLDKAMRGLETLLATLPDPSRVTVSSVMMKENLASLADFPPILARLGVKTYVLQGLIDYAEHSQKNQLLGQGELTAHVEKLIQSCKEHGVRAAFTQDDRLDLELNNPTEAVRKYHHSTIENPADSRQCMLPWEIPFIDKDGRVFACCYASQEEAEVLGDATASGLDEIWQGEPYRQFRRGLREGGQAMPAICRTCMAVPRGEHPLSLYSAEVVAELSKLRGPAPLKVVMRNTGSATWDRSEPFFLGTALPRDHESPLRVGSWTTRRRICGFREEQVAPGETATFEFDARPGFGTNKDTFQLVLDGRLWVPGTEFEVEVEGRSRPWLTLRGRLGRWLRDLRSWRPAA
ncbi:MAG: radical SAM protein [Acidobacteriota bacterium]